MSPHHSPHPFFIFIVPVGHNNQKKKNCFYHHHLASSLYFLSKVFLYSSWLSHSAEAIGLSGLALLGSAGQKQGGKGVGSWRRKQRKRKSQVKYKRRPSQPGDEGTHATVCMCVCVARATTRGYRQRAGGAGARARDARLFDSPPRRLWMESRMVRTLYTADHFSLRMSRQMLPD